MSYNSEMHVYTADEHFDAQDSVLKNEAMIVEDNIRESEEQFREDNL